MPETIRNFSAPLSNVNKVSIVLNRKYCNPHHQRQEPSRQVRTTGWARAPAQDHLAPVSDHYPLHWMLWGGWIDVFTMYIHVFDKKSNWFYVGNLVKLIILFVNCVDLQNSKTCGILMIEIAETRKRFSAPSFAMEQIMKLTICGYRSFCTSWLPPFLYPQSNYLSNINNILISTLHPRHRQETELEQHMNVHGHW